MARRGQVLVAGGVGERVLHIDEHVLHGLRPALGAVELRLQRVRRAPLLVRDLVAIERVRERALRDALQHIKCAN